jgi:hypothetical protein
MSDPLMRALAGLPEAVPDMSRTARTRQRCRTELATRGRVRAGALMAHRHVHAVWRPVVALMSVTYLVEIIGRALETYRLR